MMDKLQHPIGGDQVAGKREGEHLQLEAAAFDELHELLVRTCDGGTARSVGFGAGGGQGARAERVI